MIDEQDDLTLRPGPLLARAITMQRGRPPFDHGKQPAWRDETPHELCDTTREHYPEPRRCSAFIGDGLCYLGHPANCRWFVDSMVAAAASVSS